MSVPGQDETAALASLSPEEEAKVETPGDITGMSYGGLKARCEQEAKQAFPGRAIIVRPGLIVGPGDYTDRFTYWPVRIHRGGEVMAPGNPSDPVQFIDARDLGEWMVRLVEDRAIGVYNGTGPASRMSIAEMLYGIRATTGGEVAFTWVDAGFLAEHEVQPWQHMTVWVPGDGEFAGMSQVSIEAAKISGLTFRPLADTATDTVEWWSGLPEERRAAPKAGLPPDREQEVLAAWHEAHA
jgi:2'-hydroxyisoflavone reductase